jgi:hypothetical protein
MFYLMREREVWTLIEVSSMWCSGICRRITPHHNSVVVVEPIHLSFYVFLKIIYEISDLLKSKFSFEACIC